MAKVKLISENLKFESTIKISVHKATYDMIYVPCGFIYHSKIRVAMKLFCEASAS